MRLPPQIQSRLFLWAWRLAHQRQPDFVIGPPEQPYLERWWIIPRNHVFNIYLHKINKSDDDRALHDHPWVNASVLLNGSYVEVTPTEPGLLRVEGDVVLRRAVAAHRLVVPDRRHVWSLFLTGPNIRTWGFHCPQGWIPWREFCEPTNKGQIGKGCGEA